MEVALLLFLICLNGLFAMSEMAVATSRKARLQSMADDGDLQAQEALKLHEHPTRFLSTVQIGITLISILTGIVGENAFAYPLAVWLSVQFPIVAPFASVLAFVIVVMVVTLLSLIIGELVPKRLGQMYPETIARVVALPMRWLSIVATPLVKVLTFSTDTLLRLMGARQNSGPQVTEEEIQVLMEQGADAGVFEHAEQQMVRNVFRLDERKLTSLMVPRGDVVYLDIQDPIEVNRDKIANSHVSRFPVCRGELSDVLGIARAKDLLSQMLAGKPLDLTQGLQAPLYVPETLTGTELVENFRNSHTPAALVVDEYGEVQGLVTLKDVLEAIVGEFPTPQAEESSALQREDGSWLLDGVIALPELQDTLDLHDLPAGDSDSYHTLSGMIMLLLGRIPRTADTVEWGEWKFEVVDMDGKRIDKVLDVKLIKLTKEAIDGQIRYQTDPRKPIAITNRDRTTGAMLSGRIAKLHGHGGPVVMQLLLARCLDLGARLAEPGEFTRRAWHSMPPARMAASSTSASISSSSSSSRRRGFSSSSVANDALAMLVHTTRATKAAAQNGPVRDVGPVSATTASAVTGSASSDMPAD